MSKVFKANESTSDARVLKVGPWANPGVELIVELGDRWAKGIVIPPEDAPALAVAILEASGLVRDNCSADEAEISLEWLYAAVATREREAKEAADREALEAEALRLFATSIPFQNPSWSDLSERQKQLWTAIAETAREIHKAKS